MSISRRTCLTLFGAALSGSAQTRKPDVVAEWRRISNQTDGIVGIAALDLESGRRASLHGDERFPLASVCKLPIAMNLLAMVDEGAFTLDQPIEVLQRDVETNVSDIAPRWPAESHFRLDELLQLMVAKSDNTAVETLFRIGTPMAARFQQWHVDGIRIDRSERECGLTAAGVERIPPPEQWTPDIYQRLAGAIPPAKRREALRRFLTDPRDTATPNATVDFLSRLVRNELLSASSTERMVRIMESTTTGRQRLRGLLPPGTLVAHKTGTTATYLDLNGSTNDVGLITRPGGRGRLAIAVYVKGSTRNDAARERIIARVAKTAFDLI